MKHRQVLSQLANTCNSNFHDAYLAGNVIHKKSHILLDEGEAYPYWIATD